MASLKKRGNVYWIQYYVGGKQIRRSLETESLQIAKEKKRRIESDLAQGIDSPFPTKTPIAEVVGDYIRHCRTFKTKSSISSDLWFLGDIFGPIVEDLQPKSEDGYRHRPAHKAGRVPYVTAACFEAITTAQLSEFITAQVETKNLKPKTANRYREVLSALFNFAMRERGIRMPAGVNPAGAIKRRHVPAPTIRFLSLEQIDQQLDVLREKPILQTMVAVYIYAGLRREEALWLTLQDLDLDSGPNGVIQVCSKTVLDDRWSSKTRINRSVPISAALLPYLVDYQQRIVPGHWLFPSPGGIRWHPDNFSHALAKVNRNAGLKWTCLHFRHTFGSQLASKGESLYKIATLMGNSPEICRRHYAALAPDSLSESVDFRCKSPEFQGFVNLSGAIGPTS